MEHGHEQLLVESDLCHQQVFDTSYDTHTQTDRHTHTDRQTEQERRTRTRTHTYTRTHIRLLHCSMSSITTAYCFYRGMSEAMLGGLRGVGAVFGIGATFLFPPLHSRSGVLIGVCVCVCVCVCV